MGILEIIGMILVIIGLIIVFGIVCNLKELIEKTKIFIAVGCAIGIVVLGGVGMIFNSNSNKSISETEKEVVEKENSTKSDVVVENNQDSENIVTQHTENMEVSIGEINIKNTNASSVLSDSHGISYDSSLVNDEDNSSAWVEGSNGDGSDEWVELQFYGEEIIDEVSIVSGYVKSSDIYYKNNRPKRVKLTFSDGSENVATLEDGNFGEQVIKLDKPIKSTSVTITILEVYKGSKYNDACISEISVIGDVEKEQNQRVEKGETKEEISYKSYTNSRYSFSIKYPDFLTEVTNSANGDGVILETINGSVSLRVWGEDNISSQSVKDMYDATINTTSNIAYKSLSGNSFVISWTEGLYTYYRKTIVGEDTMNSFILMSPTSEAKVFETITTTIYDSFNVGV